MNSESRAVIDRSILQELRELQGEGDPDIVSELVELFLESAPESIEMIRESLSKGDPDLLAKAAHNLKSSSAALGAFGLSQISREMEMRGRSGDLSDASDMLNRLKAEYRQVEDALKAEIE